MQDAFPTPSSRNNWLQVFLCFFFKLRKKLCQKVWFRISVFFLFGTGQYRNDIYMKFINSGRSFPVRNSSVVVQQWILNSSRQMATLRQHCPLHGMLSFAHIRAPKGIPACEFCVCQDQSEELGRMAEEETIFFTGFFHAQKKW